MAAGAATATALAAAGAVVGYYAHRITERPADLAPRPARPDDRVHVRAVTPTSVILEGPDAARPGVWGLHHPEGYGRVGRVLGVEGDLVARRHVHLAGQRPEVDIPAALDPCAYPDDPSTVGIPYEECRYEAPLGPTPAWLFGAQPAATTWAIHVHGRSARYHEGFRLVPALADAGLPSLTIAYRDDPDGPRSPDGRSHLGATEWLDVEAAIRHALDAGARDVVLVGYSMGGTIAAACAQRSALRSRIRGLVLDAPVLDWTPVMRRAALERGLPRPVVPLVLPAAMALAAWRAGLDWDAIRHDPAALRHPTLLVHGDADPVVPVELGDTLAAARPDLVTYLRVSGGGHVRCWNHDPDAYEGALRGFLGRVLADMPAWALL